MAHLRQAVKIENIPSEWNRECINRFLRKHKIFNQFEVRHGCVLVFSGDAFHCGNMIKKFHGSKQGIYKLIATIAHV